MQKKALRWLSIILYCAAAVGGIWLAVRFLLPWAAPFIVAYAIAAILEIPVRAMVGGGWRRSIAAGVCTLAVLALVIWGAAVLVSKGISAVTDFAKQLPELMSTLGESIERLENAAFVYINDAPEGVAGYLETLLESVADAMYGLPAAVSQTALDVAARAAQNSPDTLLFLITAGIGTYFISASFPHTTAFISAQLPKSFVKKLEGLGHDMKMSFGGFFRAQLILMAMTFFELLLTFMLLQVKGAAGLAAVTALVDALPVFGTGIVLVPWAVYSLLLGSLKRGIALLICWGAVNLIRSCAQAKLLGDQIGLNPLASLFAIYVGWRVWHVWGMLLFPILLVTLQQLNDKQVIKLWNNI